MRELGKHVSGSHINVGDGLGRDEDSPDWSWRLCNGLEHALMEELGVGEEKGRAPTKEHQAGNTTRSRIAVDVVVAPNSFDPAEHSVVWPPGAPQEFEDGDADGEANAGN